MEAVNVIPIGGGAINVVFVWIWALLSDFLRTRWTLIVAQALIGLIPAIAMSVWTTHPLSVSLTTAYAGYFISYLCLGTAPLIFSWLSDLLPQDPEARSLIVGMSVAGYYAISAWSQVLVWPAKQAPYYKYGWQTSIAIWILIIVMTCALRFIDVRYLKPKRDAYNASHGQAVIGEESRQSDDDSFVRNSVAKDIEEHDRESVKGTETVVKGI